MSDRARWGILGTGGIAHIFARALQESSTCRLVAVGSRNAQSARAFAREFGVDRAHGSYSALIDDPTVEFVYVATPHTLHEDLAVAAARAGKHVLCEKPMAVNATGAARIVDAARQAGTFLMEGFAFRCHPQARRLRELLEGDEIGELRVVSATFGYDAGPAPANYLHRRELAGGGILDVGCYTVALARQIAGFARGVDFRDPDLIMGAGVLHSEAGVDLDAAALAWWEGGPAAHLMCTIRTEVDRTVLLSGSHGFIRLPAAFLPGRPDRFGGIPRIIVERHGEAIHEVQVPAPAGLYAIEADAVVAHARAGRSEAPEMSWADSLGNMAALDRWRAEVGVVYDADAAEGRAMDAPTAEAAQ